MFAGVLGALRTTGERTHQPVHHGAVLLRESHFVTFNIKIFHCTAQVSGVLV